MRLSDSTGSDLNAGASHLEKYTLDYAFIHGFLPSYFVSCISPTTAPTSISFPTIYAIVRWRLAVRILLIQPLDDSFLPEAYNDNDIHYVKLSSRVVP